MNICTIVTRGAPWHDLHLPRWVRYIRKNVPQAKLYLIYNGEKMDLRMWDYEFEKVHMVNKPADRRWLNSVRMGAVTLFDVKDMLYLDCDCDVMGDLAPIDALVKHDIGCCRSPAIHADWTKFCIERGKTLPRKEYNNGLLYMRADFTDAYNKAWVDTLKHGVSERIRGTIAFNHMLESTAFDEVPDEYGAIWWDAEANTTAKIIQFCSDAGQEKRLRLEQTLQEYWA